MWWYLLLAIVVFFPPSARADSQFITLVNPVRKSYYNLNPVQSLKAQYQVVRQNNLYATWLLTYDVIADPSLVKLIETFDRGHELGIFLEVSSNLADTARVTYRDTGSWHFANSVFLSAYSQLDRQKLIDTVFEAFKNNFGYYPVSVGSWWTDSFSLQYLHEKYGVIADLGVADQYSTDNYQVWGTYWSTPFYPSKLHAGIPAGSVDNKIGVVTLQWAARHPRQGYYSSLYSLQDYFTTLQKYDTAYFADLVKSYVSQGSNEFGQVTVGLEGDLSPEVYNGEYARQLEVVSALGAAKVTMKEFASWYRRKFPDLSPPHKISAQGVVWYQSPRYRVGVDTENHKIFDLRVYPQNYPEPYYSWPNDDTSLRIYIPSVIDSLQNPDEVWNYGEGEVRFFPDYFEVLNGQKPLPKLVNDSPLVDKRIISNGWHISAIDSWPVDPEGFIFRNWKLETRFLFKSPRKLLQTIFSGQWNKFIKDYFWVHPAEFEGLLRLKLLPAGKVLVYDAECLQCPWFSRFRPAALANYRSYVSQISGKRLVTNRQVFTGSDRTEVKKQLQKTKAKYVYLTKYKQDWEKLPFSPGDLGVEEYFENAYVKIWKVVK